MEGVCESTVTGLQTLCQLLAVNAGWRKGSDKPTEIHTEYVIP